MEWFEVIAFLFILDEWKNFCSYNDFFFTFLLDFSFFSSKLLTVAVGFGSEKFWNLKFRSF